jgi:transposase
VPFAVEVGMSGRQKRTPDGSQPVLAFEVPTVPESVRERGCTRFVDDSPYGLFIGAERLDQFLEESGLGWVVRLRAELERVDFSSLETAYRAGGRPPYHPRTILGLIVYGIMSRQWSLRDIEQLAVRDVGAWWICGGLRPDHSTVGEFVQRHADVLTVEFVVSLVKDLVRRLRLKRGVVAGDGTVIEAVASRYRTLQREAAQLAAQKALEQAAACPQDEELAAKAEQAVEVATVVEDRAVNRKLKGRDPNKASVAPGELEAVVQPRKDGAVRPAYRPCVLVHEEGLIVAQAVEPSSELVALETMLGQHREIFAGDPTTMLLDGGFCTVGVLRDAVERNVDVLCPSGKALGEESWQKAGAKGRYGKKDFVYDEQRNAYRCPAGEWLTQKRQGHEKTGYRYQLYSTTACRQCSIRQSCTKSRTGRTIKRYEGEIYKEAMALVLSQPRARAQYARRRTLGERPFAELRFRQGLFRFHRRGLAGAAVDFALHCIAFDLKWALGRQSVLFLFVVVLRQAARRDGNPSVAIIIALPQQSPPTVAQGAC